MSLPAIFDLSVPAGMELLEARNCRLFPSLSHIGFVDRAIIAARNRRRAELETIYRITA